ncbi:MAG: nitrogenase [Lentisphaeria bacterium]|nr:nitrogenase [Lentisphaeria bacterium]
MKHIMEQITIPIKEASFPQPFPGGLEFNAPARGMWNIVHTGMLLPEAHQIFVCARGCLRGVILTAAEMNAMDRMSWVGIEENDFFDSSMEENVIEGVTDILNKLSGKPPVVLVFVSCVQLFAGIDFPECLRELSKRFPHTTFVDCYMNPTMRKSGLTPDQLMRRQLFVPLKNTAPLEKNAINLLGSDFAADRSCELFTWLDENKIICREITKCSSFSAYQEMGKSSLNMTWIPQAVAAAESLENRLGQKHLHLPISYGEEEIENNYKLLAQALDLNVPDFSEARQSAGQALAHALKIIGNTPIALDYTAAPRILSLTRRLLEAGFNVTQVFADLFIPGDRKDFEFLQKNFPSLKITPTLHVNMRFANNGHLDEKILAVGQKAAFFTGSVNFVDLVWGRGFYGHSGVAAIAGLMIEAFRNPKDIESVITHKGWGCESCL